MSKTAIGKATGGAESCCASLNLTDSHWKKNAAEILQGCVGMKRYKFHSCATQPGCHQADSTGCLKDWFPFGDSCFSLHLPDLTWTEASSVCKKEGSDLASVHSEEESAFISRMLPNRICWIGASNVNYEEKWRWSDGSSWKNHSRAQEIMNESGIGAIGIDFRGNWHRVSTSKEKHCFVCKLMKETTKNHDGQEQTEEQQQNDDKEHIPHTMWAIPVLLVFLLALGGAFYAKKIRQKRTEVGLPSIYIDTLLELKERFTKKLER